MNTAAIITAQRAEESYQRTDDVVRSDARALLKRCDELQRTDNEVAEEIATLRQL